MSPYLLEALYQRLGEPRWFWPLVMVLLIVLFGIAGAIADPADLEGL